MKKVNISQVDTIFVDGSYPIEYLLYYKEGVNTEQLRTAMKELSSDFWPLFGRYDRGQIYFEKYSEQEHFDEEESNREFNRKASEKDVHEHYGRMIPSEWETQFFLKVIQYPNGMVLIPKLKHLAGDGYSYFYFLSILAALSKGTRMTASKKLMYSLYKPHHERTVLKDFHFSGMEFDPFEDKKITVSEMKKIPKSDIRTRIKKIASKLDQRVSSNDILSAMIIKELVSNKKGSFSETFQLVIPIDVRKHIKEYGLKFIGNALFLNSTHFKNKDVMHSGVDDIAVEIRRSMPSVTKELYLEYLVRLEDYITKGQKEKLRAFDPEEEFLITNLSKLPVDRLDFGKGPPDLIFPLTIEKNAAGIMADEENYILRFTY